MIDITGFVDMGIPIYDVVVPLKKVVGTVKVIESPHASDVAVVNETTTFRLEYDATRSTAAICRAVAVTCPPISG